MAKQITDDEDRLKRQSRRRLIGAVALTTAIVVILPMVLDSEPKLVGQDIELRIPDKDKVGAFTPKIDLPPVSAPVAEPVASAVANIPAPTVIGAPLPQVSVEPMPPTGAASVVKPSVLPPSVPPAAPEQKSKPEPKLEPKHESKPEPKHEPKPEPVKHAEPAKHAETIKTEVKHEVKKHTEQVASGSQQGYVVQIGAFSSADTAHTWQRNLNQQGFRTYTEKVNDKIRVRAGPYATREEANKVHQKIDAKGLHSNVVELD